MCFPMYSFVYSFYSFEYKWAFQVGVRDCHVETLADSCVSLVVDQAGNSTATAVAAVGREMVSYGKLLSRNPSLCCSIAIVWPHVCVCDAWVITRFQGLPAGLWHSIHHCNVWLLLLCQCRHVCLALSHRTCSYLAVHRASHTSPNPCFATVQNIVLATLTRPVPLQGRPHRLPIFTLPKRVALYILKAARRLLVLPMPPSSRSGRRSRPAWAQ